MRKRLLLILIILLSVLIHTTPIHAYTSQPSNIYVVQAGDTLPSIAKNYSTTVDKLRVSNGLQSDTLIIGQKLWVPVFYEITSGDTLKEIAKKLHSSIELIQSANNLTDSQLYPGQILKIPPRKFTINDQHILMNKEEFKNWLFHQEITRNVELIQQHHTWIPSYKRFNGSNHFELLRGMKNSHIQNRGWSNIVQNVTTFPDGKVAVSRPLNIAPEGSIGEKANFVGIAIENIGNFDSGQDQMTKEQKETIVYITALLCIKFGLTPSIDSITYHHWWNLKTGEKVLDDGKDYEVKTCPGTGFFGGNSTTSAKKYFYPLVSQKMEEILASME